MYEFKCWSLEYMYSNFLLKILNAPAGLDKQFYADNVQKLYIYNWTYAAYTDLISFYSVDYSVKCMLCWMIFTDELNSKYQWQKMCDKINGPWIRLSQVYVYLLVYISSLQMKKTIINPKVLVSLKWLIWRQHTVVAALTSCRFVLFPQIV